MGGPPVSNPPPSSDSSNTPDINTSNVGASSSSNATNSSTAHYVSLYTIFQTMVETGNTVSNLLTLCANQGTTLTNEQNAVNESLSSMSATYVAPTTTDTNSTQYGADLAQQNIEETRFQQSTANTQSIQAGMNQQFNQQITQQGAYLNTVQAIFNGATSVLTTVANVGFAANLTNQPT